MQEILVPDLRAVWPAGGGSTVVHGGMMSSAAWQDAKAASAILPAGQVTPGPKVWTGEDDPNAASAGVERITRGSYRVWNADTTPTSFQVI